MAVVQAKRLGVTNFSMLVSHVLVPPAISAILSSPENRVQGFLAAGHVCAVMGTAEYFPLATKFNVPIVVTGFEPLDLLQGISMTVGQLEHGRTVVENQYARVVRPEGNVPAKKIIEDVFEVVDRKWRGIGNIPSSGYRLKSAFEMFDAEKEFSVEGIVTHESPLCIAGQVLRGLKKPHDCTAFGGQCTPEHPLGAPMVSSEGACAAYYHFGKAGSRAVG
jgi:hydrogenase expression/formation protein HypD